MNLNVNGVVMLGIILGVKQYADSENMIAEWIPRRLGVFPITSMPVYGLLLTRFLTYSVILSSVSLVISSKDRLGGVTLGWFRLGWVWSAENY